MIHPHGEEKGFARAVEFPDGASVYIGSLHVADFKLEIEQTHNPAWTPERAANNLAYQINAAHAARVRPLVEAAEALKAYDDHTCEECDGGDAPCEEAVRLYTVATELNAKALEEFRK